MQEDDAKEVLDDVEEAEDAEELKDKNEEVEDEDEGEGEGEGKAVGPKEGTQNLDLILDIPLNVTVELGRSKMLINDLLQLSQGSVVELTKLVGEPLEVLVNQKLVARGEVVVVNEKFGVRLTDIVSPLERVQTLT